ncbi:MAG: DNA adenine methylase [Chloroflexi bacterium]|nr:MAG: DNA adenine methylase [Chloroflexota bacterium]
MKDSNNIMILKDSSTPVVYKVIATPNSFKMGYNIELTEKFGRDHKLSTHAPSRPLARYPGSKNRLAPWIIEHIPAYHDTYILPYGGMAATLFKKVRSGIEVYNDLDGDAVHLFRTIREDKDALIDAIAMTPWSPEELELASSPTDVPVERARRFFCRLWMAYYPYDLNLCFRRQMKYSRGSSGKSSMVPAAKLFADIDYLFVVAERLRGVILENRTALEILATYDYDRAFFYCDPPYTHDTRSRTTHYSNEMGIEQHRELGKALNNIQGMAIVSGYASPLYKELYEDRGWLRVDKLARTNGHDKIESIWLNRYTAEELERETTEREEEAIENERQLRMFG